MAKGHTNVDRKKLMRPQLYPKNFRQLRKLGVGEVVFPIEEHTNRRYSVNQPMLKPSIQVTVCKVIRLYFRTIYLCTYIHMQAITIVKTGH